MRALIVSVTIPRHVQILCSECFSYCESLSSISFETDPELTHIESNAFYDCSSLESITIPRHVQILCSEYFSYCESLSSISFETDSEMMRVETGAFTGTALDSVVVPGSASIITSNSFRLPCPVTLAGTDSDVELSDGNLSRFSGSSDTFKRKS
jgi:hypothetical protein